MPKNLIETIALLTLINTPEAKKIRNGLVRYLNNAISNIQSFKGMK